MREQPLIRLLLCEDDSDDAALELRELKRAGLRTVHEIVFAKEPFARALREFAPDIVISDFSMPGFDGMEALRLSREHAPDTPFIFVSGTLGEDYAIRALKSGATDYVLKSNLVRLPAAVERALEGASERRARRSAQVALRRAQGMARLAHVVTGDAGTFDSWSDSLPGMVGLEQGTMPRSTREWLELLHAEDREAFRQASIDAAATGSRVDVEYRLRHADGKWLHIRQAVEPLAAALGAGNSGQWFSTLQDITQQKLAEEAVRKAEENYRSVFNNSTVGIFIIETGGRVSSANPALARILGYLTTLEMLSGISDVAREVYVDPGARRRYRELLKVEGAVTNFETQWRRRDGSVIWVSLNGREVRDEAGVALHQLGMVEDITERKVAEIHVTRLNRVYAVLSRINSLIVRARTREELFREACRIAAEDGKFPLAWIGLVDDAAKSIEIVASAGDGEGYLASMPLRLDVDRPGGPGLGGQAIGEAAAMIVNDVETDPRMLIREEALARGFRALVVLPLIVAHKPIGVMALYSEQAGFFDEQEMRLLNELAGDISFAVDHIVKSEKLEYLSYYDPLTGLANRMLLLDRLTQLVHADAGSGKLALAILDIQRFKTINDSLGRHAGDELLGQIAKRLVGLVGDASRVARTGADQFAVIVPQVKKEERVAAIIEDGFAQIEGQAFPLAGTDLRIAIRAGIALSPNDGAEADTLFRNAEAALKKAKAGGERYLFYTQKMTERISERLSLENRLRQAIEKEEFVLHYQPKVDLEKRAIVGLEALIRWQTPEGLMPPMHFIPLLEETGLIMQAGAWALRKAVLDHRRWAEQGLKPPRVAVNVSSIQLRQRDFVSLVEQAISGSPAGASALDLEITESLIMEDVEATIAKLEAIRKLGVEIAIDDFGTGYSSLGYLARLPVQSLKIDRSFIIRMEKDRNALTLVSTIISLAHALHLTVVAEGVETESQAQALRELRCDAMQGYLFNKPVAEDAIGALLRASR